MKSAIKKYSVNRKHWQLQAKKFKASHWVSWGDINMINLEIRNIRNHIPNNSSVLDAGCSNGFSTLKIAKGKKISMTALDLSPLSIAQAKKINYLKDKVKFSVGDVTDIDYDKNKFDLAYTIRVLINLPTWAMQQKAIKEIHRVLKPGGQYLLSEAFNGSLQKLNNLRSVAGLKSLKPPAFNYYLDEKKLEKFITPYFKIEKIEKFSSLYYLGSRFIRDLAKKSSDADSYKNQINNFFYHLKPTNNSGDFGVQKLYILKKIK